MIVNINYLNIPDMSYHGIILILITCYEFGDIDYTKVVFLIHTSSWNPVLRVQGSQILELKIMFDDLNVFRCLFIYCIRFCIIGDNANWMVGISEERLNNYGHAWCMLLHPWSSRNHSHLTMSAITQSRSSMRSTRQHTSLTSLTGNASEPIVELIARVVWHALRRETMKANTHHSFLARPGWATSSFAEEGAETQGCRL